MNLKIFLISENKKYERRKKDLSAHERHKFYMIREFIKFCLSSGVSEIQNIDGKIYSNFVRYLKHTKNNNERTRTDKCFAVKHFLENSNCLFAPNPKRRPK